MTREDFANAYCEGLKMTNRFLISRGVSRDDAEEIAQAAWVRGWERLPQLRDERLLLTWANSIAMNLYCTRARVAKRNVPLYSEGTHFHLADIGAVDARRILNLCRSRDRRLLASYYLDGRATREIAATEGLSETAVRIRLMRARRAAQQKANSRSASKAASAA